MNRPAAKPRPTGFKVAVRVVAFSPNRIPANAAPIIIIPGVAKVPRQRPASPVKVSVRPISPRPVSPVKVSMRVSSVKASAKASFSSQVDRPPKLPTILRNVTSDVAQIAQATKALTKTHAGGKLVQVSRSNSPGAIASLKSAVSQVMPKNIADFESISKLGEGSFGSVFSMRDKISGETVVVKMINKTDMSRGQVVEEFDILQRLEPVCREFILCGREFLEDDKKYYIVSEYLDGYTTLDKFLETSNVDKQDFRLIFVNLVEGLKLIHANGVVHRDIKPQNLMINPGSGDIKYIDFGISCMDNACYVTGPAGTPSFSSPEIDLNSDKTYTKNQIIKGDYWALGLTLVNLILKESPQMAIIDAHLDNLKMNSNAEYRRIIRGNFTAYLAKYYEDLRTSPGFPAKMLNLVHGKIYEEDEVNLAGMLEYEFTLRKLPDFRSM